MHKAETQTAPVRHLESTIRFYGAKLCRMGKKLSYDTLLRYKDFFDLFDSFIGYTHFFLLEDLIDEKQKIKCYLPFDDFKTRPSFSDIDDYIMYKNGVMNFIK